LGGDGRTEVVHGEFDLGVASVHHHGHRRLGGAVFARVAHQVEDNLREPIGVPSAGYAGALVDPKDDVARRGGLAELVDGLAGHLAQVDGPGMKLEPAPQTRLREVEDVADEMKRPLDATPNSR